VRKILVIRFSSLGDVVLDPARLSALARGHPDAHIARWSKDAYADVLKEDNRSMK